MVIDFQKSALWTKHEGGRRESTHVYPPQDDHDTTPTSLKDYYTIPTTATCFSMPERCATWQQDVYVVTPTGTMGDSDRDPAGTLVQYRDGKWFLWATRGSANPYR